MQTALGEKIRRLRTQKRLTLDKLGELTGSSKSYIWELENKNPPRPSAAKLARIAETLDTTLDYLLDSEGRVSEEEAADARFYRNYRRMPSTTRQKIRRMVKLWNEDE